MRQGWTGRVIPALSGRNPATVREVLIVVVVFRTIWTFNKFEEIYLLTKGGPGTSTFNLAVYSFEQSIASLKLGVGAATGVVMMAYS